MRILGLDYGSARVGYAISDETLSIARPLGILSPKEFLAELPKLISDQEIGLILLGLPIGMSGQSTAQTQETLEFKKKLEKQTELNIVTFDERWSSEFASKQAARKVRIDDEAAAIILQNYLDTKKNERI